MGFWQEKTEGWPCFSQMLKLGFRLCRTWLTVTAWLAPTAKGAQRRNDRPAGPLLFY